MPYSKNPATMYAILDELSKLKALDIDYDNISSGLVSTKIQGAIDELSLLISGGTGSTVSQDLDSVLTVGNNAGLNDIDLNGNDLLNVDNINLNTINGAAYPPTGSTVGSWGTLNYPVWTSGTPFVIMTAAGTFNLDNTTYVDNTDSRLTDSRTPTGTANGDLSGTYPNPTVDGLQGNPVENIIPSNGQILQWNGGAWIPGAVPTGGSGGGGIFYYLNYQNTTDISPTTGLPTSPVPPSQLGIGYSTGSGSITSADLTLGSYSLICGFVTIAGTPAVTNIPAGLWDFNIWAKVAGGTGQGNQTQFQIRVYKYDSGTGIYTSLANSDDIYIYDPVTIAQYIGNVTMPQTTILSTDRIYVELWAQKNVNQTRQVQFYFDSLHPSHVHTTLPSVAGTGIAKVINGVFQSPASTIVDADVSATAAIAQSKLNLTDAAADGSTKGIASFTASDFNSVSGLISIDYTNGQAASGSNKGFLTSSDWTTFNGKESALTFSAPLSRSVNTISIPVATSLVDGYLSSTDWAAFNGKQDALSSGVNIKTVQSTSIVGSGDVTITDANLSTSDITTNDVSISKHGFAPKAPNDATKFLDGTGLYDTVKDSDLVITDTLTNNVSITKHGFAPKAPNDTTKYLRGDGTWATVSVTDAAGWTTKVKSANQDITNNSTLQDDTELLFPVVAGGHYMVELDIVISANNTTGDYKSALSVSAGTMKGQGILIGNTATATAQVVSTNANGAAVTTSISIGTLAADIDLLTSVKIIYSFTASANANFEYQFANVTAAAGRISRTWKGSILRYKRID